jgi:RNA polymerase sigma factor (sigma-70 family)
MAAHAARVSAICYALLHSDADTQDAVQDTFVRCLPVLGQLSGDHAAFVNTVARNVCRDELRRRARRAAIIQWNNMFETSGGPEATVIDRHTLRELWADLPPRDRHLLGRRIAGFTCREIAQQLGLRVGSVTSGLSRAYQRAQIACAHDAAADR